MTAGTAAAGVAGAPVVPKAALKVGRGLAGASDKTAVSGALGWLLFGRAEPKIGVSILGTSRIFGLVGRASSYISAAFTVADIGTIASCVKKAGNVGGGAFGGGGASGTW